jgi:hydrogenase maturation protein HypF
MERRTIAIRGIVQGVGFRPFVYTLASRLALAGFVRNQPDGLLIEVEGEPDRLDLFEATLRDSPPPQARIDELSSGGLRSRGDSGFCIEVSGEAGPVRVAIPPDLATCDDCLRELFDPADRRYRYPFMTCTQCGPRLTIATGAPYDRERTTMAGFHLCGACRAEYENPADRRFHAQPIACPACGPQLALRDGTGRPVRSGDPIAAVARALAAGRIAAIKGLGGYHLACDAASHAAVEALRHRKHRDEKPFAVMLADAAAAAAVCEMDDVERALLTSPRRPIVLLRRRAGSEAAIAASVAPGNPWLGVMLPYAPVHYLLMRDVQGCALVMTSGNRSDEPIAYEDDDAVRRLAGIADLFLVHDRPIHVRCDDSVARVVAGAELLVRRSRGYAPEPIRLPFECPRPILAVGGQLKATFAFARGRQAFVSHHLGDLDEYSAYAAFVRDVELYRELFAFGADPLVVAHDTHPDYASTQYAAGLAGVSLAPVQHHHAHVASAMTEHGLAGPVIGIASDSTRYGDDGAIWGGDILVADRRTARRAAHLRYVRLPGGDRAIREPWRMALAHLLDAGEDADGLPPALQVAAGTRATVTAMIERGLNAPLTSSAGRLFDAVASLAGVRQVVSFEAQAALELEWLAAASPEYGAYPFDIEAGAPMAIDTRPLVRAVARDVRAGLATPVIGRRFHRTLVDVLAEVCRRIQAVDGLDQVVLTGGVFFNALLADGAAARLAREGFRVYCHRLVPPGDGGLSLGQLAVAAARPS